MEPVQMKPCNALTRSALCALTLVLAACSSVTDQAIRLGGLIEPYRVEVVQGNVVTREQLAVLQKGMGRNQVREILGTPLITSLFHAQRWDYAFTIKRAGTQPLQRRVSVFFENDRVTAIEADDLPTEAEFTARIDSQIKGKIKIPKLQATAEDLKPYERKPSDAPQAPVAPPPVNMAYPPLEPQ
jgi:outer membrane protein assembly factor BamE